MSEQRSHWRGPQPSGEDTGGGAALDAESRSRQADEERRGAARRRSSVESWSVAFALKMFVFSARSTEVRALLVVK